MEIIAEDTMLCCAQNNASIINDKYLSNFN
mgnify:CR=1 FL=1